MMNHLYCRSPPIALLLFASSVLLFLAPSFVLPEIVVDQPTHGTDTNIIIDSNNSNSRPQGFLRKRSESAAATGGKIDDENIHVEQHGQEPIEELLTDLQNQDEPGENSQDHEELKAETQRGLKHYKGYGYKAYPKAHKKHKGYGYYYYGSSYYGSHYYGRSYYGRSYYGSSYYGRSHYGSSYYGYRTSPYSYVSSNYHAPHTHSPYSPHTQSPHTHSPHTHSPHTHHSPYSHSHSYVFNNYRAPQGYSSYGYGYRERD